MNHFVRCRMCGVEIPAGDCVFAVHKRLIDGVPYRFCCEPHAAAFEKRRRKVEKG